MERGKRRAWRGESQREALHQYHRVLLDVLRVQLFVMLRHNVFEDEVLRQQEAQLDLDEAKVLHIEQPQGE